MTEHTLAIQKELKAWGYSIDSFLFRDDYDGIEGDHEHRVTISYKGRRMVTTFTSGCGHRHLPGRPLTSPRNNSFKRLTVYDVEWNKRTVPNDPDLEDVLYCLLSDASVGRYAMSFRDFCGEFGYDEDSRKALSIYEKCLETYSDLRDLGVDFDALDELLADF